MYNKNNILYIVSAIAAIDKVNHYVKNFDTAAELLVANHQVYFNATITLLIAIAEEVKKIDVKILESHPTFRWKKIADMRNVLAHDYRGVDDEIEFDVVKNDLPKLKFAFIEFIKLFPKSEIELVINTKHYRHLNYVL